ncbi:immunoglobulin I-set domain protein [Cooperia oncophora]
MDDSFALGFKKYPHMRSSLYTLTLELQATQMLGNHPSFYSDAQVVKFDEKSDASFTCPIYSVPGSKVEWSRVDGDLPPNADQRFRDNRAGMYCVNANSSTTTSSKVSSTLKYLFPTPSFKFFLTFSSESVNVGDRFELWFDCKVTGDPSAVISWSKEGELMNYRTTLQPVTGGRLLFNEVTEDNAGVYKCRAKTKAGPLETRTVLNIGSAKRKRKHTRGRHARRNHRRRAANALRQHKKKLLTHSTFGSWFSTSH